MTGERKHIKTLVKGTEDRQSEAVALVKTGQESVLAANLVKSSKDRYGSLRSASKAEAYQRYSVKKKADDTGTGSTEQDFFTDKARTKRRTAKKEELDSVDTKRLSIGAIAGKALVDELDDSEETSGLGTIAYRALPNKARRKSVDLLTDKAARSASKKAATRAGQLSRPEAKARAMAAGKAKSVKAAASAAKQAATIKAASAKAVSATTTSFASVAVPALMTVGIIVMVLLVIGGLVSVIFGAVGSEETKANSVGLPVWITDELIEAVLDAQTTYGDPAGCNLAQILVESGAGDEPSGLATKDRNLYGMKWAESFRNQPEVVGPSAWQTSEYENGGYVTVTASFTKFKSWSDCVKFRSRVFLAAGTYSNNALIQQAKRLTNSDRMAEGLAESWATSPTYTASLKTMMDTYDLRRFDGMTVAEFRALSANGQSISQANTKQMQVVRATKTTPFAGQNYCATWVSRALSNANVGIGYCSGDACDQVRRWCWSKDKRDLKVGMIVGYTSDGGTGMGGIYGHVGIYIGNGIVRNNTSSIVDTPIDTFISWSAGGNSTYWGWANGVDLTR